MLSPLVLPPGMFRAGTEYQSRGRWYDGSLVRFAYNTIQPVGGWVAINSVAVSGRPCALHAWTPNTGAGARYLAVGTNTKAYVYDGDAQYDITPSGFTTGSANGTTDVGYGGGLYGAGLYGTPRSGTGGITPVQNWHFDSWGEFLVGCYSADGRLLEWQLNTANDFAVISNAPTSCRGMVVTAERIMMALGAGGDKRKVQWSDVEDNTDWTPALNGFAGDFLLTTDGAIVTGERVRGGVLIHTTTDAHLATYVGLPVVYSFDRIGDQCGILSAGAKVATGSFVAWMSENGFYIFDGYVRPLPCDVHDYVFSSLNRVQASKVAAWHNGQWGEIWWFYPANGASENNRYICWNYRENHWTIGALSRTAGIDSGVWNYPICVDASGIYYYHENGWTNNGTDRGADVFLESGPTELAPGERLSWLNQVIHDESDSADYLQLVIKTKFTPEGQEYTKGPYSLNAANGYTDVRAQGRAYKVRLEEVTSGNWKLGTLRFDVRTASKR